MNKLLKAARAWVKDGVSVVATGSHKRALLSWTKFQHTLPTDAELLEQFTNPACAGIAIICGAVSGNRELIDIDTKYDITGMLYENLCSEIISASPTLFDKLLIVETRSGGKHFWYKCQKIEGNKKLARRPATTGEIKENPNEKVFVLIETRGEGGYAIAPPTDNYRVIAGDKVNEISIDERELLMEICRSFNEYVEEVKITNTAKGNETFAISPWEDYNIRGVDDMLQRLQNHGWSVVRDKVERIIFKRPGKTDSKSSGDYHKDFKLFKVFTTSSIFEEGKGYKPASVFTVLECDGDYKKAAKSLSELGYGEKKQHYGKLEKQVFQKKLEGYSKEDLIKIIAKDGKKNEEEAEEILSQMEKQWGETICAFWDVLIDADNKKKIIVNKTRFIDFLNTVGGFGLYFYDTGSTIFRVVRVQDGMAEESSTEQMKKFLLEYIDALPDNFDNGTTPDVLKELLMRQYAALFNEGFLEFLPHINLDLLRDEKECSYFPFRNGVIVVDKDKVIVKTYKEIGKIIWKAQVIDFSIEVDQHFAPEACEFYRFIEKISGEEIDRLAYCITLIGYLLHRYKDPGRPWAVILAEETENEKDGGGTGKGILIKAIAKLLSTVKVNGKGFNPDKNFVWQRVSLQTQLIAIEDCDRNLDFEKFNSHITEGATVEKKNKDELFIEYRDSPKMMFTTNYTVNIKGNHGKRRSKIFEFSPFFSPENKPDDYFGHLLFDDWDADEYNRFYNLLFFCLSMYLLKGVLEVVNSEKLRRKQIRLQWGDEFLEWFDHYRENGCEKWIAFKELYGGFMIENDLEKKEYSSKRFKKAMETSTELYGNQVQTQRNRAMNNQHEVRICIKDEKTVKKTPDVPNEDPISEIVEY